MSKAPQFIHSNPRDSYNLQIQLNSGRSVAILDSESGIAVLNSTQNKSVGIIGSLIECCYLQNLPIIVFNSDEKFIERQEIPLEASLYNASVISLPLCELQWHKILTLTEQQIIFVQLNDIDKLVVEQVKAILQAITHQTKISLLPWVIVMNDFPDYCSTESLQELEYWLNQRRNRLLPIFNFTKSDRAAREVERIVLSCATKLFFNPVKLISKKDAYFQHPSWLKLLPPEMHKEIQAQEWVMETHASYELKYFKFSNRDIRQMLCQD